MVAVWFSHPDPQLRHSVGGHSDPIVRSQNHIKLMFGWSCRVMQVIDDLWWLKSLLHFQSKCLF